MHDILNRIRENPNDDAPWVILADWWLEQGAQWKSEIIHYYIRQRNHNVSLDTYGCTCFMFACGELCDDIDVFQVIKSGYACQEYIQYRIHKHMYEEVLQNLNHTERPEHLTVTCLMNPVWPVQGVEIDATG